MNLPYLKENRFMQVPAGSCRLKTKPEKLVTLPQVATTSNSCRLSNLNQGPVFTQLLCPAGPSEAPCTLCFAFSVV